jgi:uncharacterized UBP type Zn finger protein
MSMAQKCEHFDSVKDNGISQRTKGCEECEKEGTNWVAIRMCLTCGHVGCCDSSEGLHARKHFEQTNHPMMIELPRKSWKWWYVHDQYN